MPTDGTRTEATRTSRSNLLLGYLQKKNRRVFTRKGRRKANPTEIASGRFAEQIVAIIPSKDGAPSSPGSIPWDSSHGFTSSETSPSPRSGSPSTIRSSFDDRRVFDLEEKEDDPPSSNERDTRSDRGSSSDTDLEIGNHDIPLELRQQVATPPGRDELMRQSSSRSQRFIAGIRRSVQTLRKSSHSKEELAPEEIEALIKEESKQKSLVEIGKDKEIKAAGIVKKVLSNMIKETNVQSMGEAMAWAIALRKVASQKDPNLNRPIVKMGIKAMLENPRSNLGALAVDLTSVFNIFTLYGAMDVVMKGSGMRLLLAISGYVACYLLSEKFKVASEALATHAVKSYSDIKEQEGRVLKKAQKKIKKNPSLSVGVRTSNKSWLDSFFRTKGKVIEAKNSWEKSQYDFERGLYPLAFVSFLVPFVGMAASSYFKEARGYSAPKAKSDLDMIEAEKRLHHAAMRTISNIAELDGGTETERPDNETNRL